MRRSPLTQFISAFLTGICMFFTVTSVPLTEAAGKIYYYHNDALGSPVAMTDKDRNVVWQREYKPFGEDVTIGSNQLQSNTHTFTGKEKDSETGLIYFGARYYDPSIGRFVSVDPVRKRDSGNPAEWNMYAYAENNPYNKLDPDGKRTYLLNGIHNTNSKGPPEYMLELQKRLKSAGVTNIVPVPLFNSFVDRLPLLGHLYGVGAVGLEWMNVNTWERRAWDTITSNLKNNPLQPGEQFNIIGTSGGGPVGANFIERFRESGINNGRIDHFITIGSPIGIDFIGDNVDFIGNIWSGGDPLSWKYTNDPIGDYRSGWNGHTGYFKDPQIQDITNQIIQWGVR